jgi:sugar phosphate permease
MIATREDGPPPRAASWGTLLLLGAGYVSIYLCRKNLGVAIPLLQEAYHVKKEGVGWIASAGTVAYAVGKLVNGPLVDRIGGRAGFLLALLGVALFGAATAFAPGLALLGIFYAVNRFAGAGGWGAVMKLIPSWIPARSVASAVAILSVSYVAGGALATLLASSIVKAGGGWRLVMGGPAIITLAMLGVAALALRRGPLGRGRVADKQAGPHPASHGFSWEALGELFRRRDFLVICGLSFVVTLLREAFNVWSVDFMTGLQGGTKALSLAAYQSVGYDVAGVFGILIMGAAYGWLSPPRRRWVLVASLTALASCCFALRASASWAPADAAVLLALVGFLVYGPFSLLSGVMALDTGGERLVATAAGITDGVGYLASGLSGAALGRIVDIGGYPLGFSVLAIASVAAAVLALFFRPSHPVVSAEDGTGPREQPAEPAEIGRPAGEE